MIWHSSSTFSGTPTDMQQIQLSPKQQIYLDNDQAITFYYFCLSFLIQLHLKDQWYYSQACGMCGARAELMSLLALLDYLGVGMGTHRLHNCFLGHMENVPVWYCSREKQVLCNTGFWLEGIGSF